MPMLCTVGVARWVRMLQQIEVLVMHWMQQFDPLAAVKVGELPTWL